MIDQSLVAKARQILAQATQHRTMEMPHAPTGQAKNPNSIVIEPAAENAKEVFWEQADGSIVGGCKPEFLAKVGHGEQASYWIVTEHQGQARWVRSDRLRSRRQFEAQEPRGERP